MGKPFERVLIVMLENQYRSYVMQNPFMKKLAAAGANMTNYFGAFHPSQTNYVASLAAEVCAVTNDDPPVSPLMQQTLVDLMEANGTSWKAYMEGYPGEPWKSAWQSPKYPAADTPMTEFPNDGTALARYFRKHNAFASFHTIQKEQERWEKIVGDEVFWQDLNKGTLPEYSWFTPDIWNDGHYVYNTHVDTNPRTELVQQIASWLEYVFLGTIPADKVQGGGKSGVDNIGLGLDIDKLLQDPEEAWKDSLVPPGTLIVITFDEADYSAVGYDTNYEGPNQVYTVLLGDMIEPGTVIDTPHNHYSLMKSIELNYGLGSLGKNDEEANWLRSLWGETFAWSEAASSGIPAAGNLAISSLDNQFYMASAQADGGITFSTLVKDAWEDVVAPNCTTSGQLAAASLDDSIYLFTVNNDKQIEVSIYAHGQWEEAATTQFVTSGSITTTAYQDYADGTKKLMICWLNQHGFIDSAIFDGSWGPIIPTNQLTDGPMTLAQMGASLYLVYKERNSRNMRMTTFNTGPFNAFAALSFDGKPDPINDTSLHQWAPADREVGHFALKMGALQDDYLAMGPIAMASIEGEMHLLHRGAYSDTPQVQTSFWGLTGIFTASHPYSNGYGTMAQGGWTPEETLDSIEINPTSPFAVGSDGTQLLVAWVPADGSGEVQYLTGGYAGEIDLLS